MPQTRIPASLSSQAMAPTVIDGILSEITGQAYLWDKSRRLLSLNDSAETALGRPKADLVGKRCADLGFDEPLARQIEQELLRIFLIGETSTSEREIGCEDDSHSYRLRLKPLLD